MSNGLCRQFPRNVNTKTLWLWPLIRHESVILLEKLMWENDDPRLLLLRPASSFVILAPAAGRLISTAFRRSCPAMGPDSVHYPLPFLRHAAHGLRLESPCRQLIDFCRHSKRGLTQKCLTLILPFGRNGPRFLNRIFETLLGNSIPLKSSLSFGKWPPSNSVTMRSTSI